jgi:hypothetical protein
MAMTTVPTEWTEPELLQTHPIAEPLVAGGVRCHGGFDEDGHYVSPRTLNRMPAIGAWQEQRARQFGTPLLDIGLDRWPEHYPNVAQTKYLLSEGITEPFVAILTRIGTVEGFGEFLRFSPIPPMERCFDEDITGTAISHLGRGLYEAHARDEAGFEDEGGHKQMWFAARDIAFDRPVTADQTAFMLERMGLSGTPGKGGPDTGGVRKQMLGLRTFDDVDFDLEMLITRMTSLLLIEISAFHTFAWAEEVLADPDLVAGDGEAARLVSYIRADERPHVEYLKTALSEMRDRTIVGESGRKIPGAEVIGTLWEQATEASLVTRRDDLRNQTLAEIERALDGNPRRGEILERMHALGSVRPTGDGRWEPVEG